MIEKECVSGRELARNSGGWEDSLGGLNRNREGRFSGITREQTLEGWEGSRRQRFLVELASRVYEGPGEPVRRGVGKVGPALESSGKVH